MKKKNDNNRREFLKLTGMSALGLMASESILSCANPGSTNELSSADPSVSNLNSPDMKDINLIGTYGPWAVSLTEDKLPSLSYRNNEFSDVDSWRTIARGRLIERLGIPNLGGLPKATVKNISTFDGLSIEEISWQLPYGRPTEALVLKPQNAKGKLPGILAFHDHGGNKYFGKQKITRMANQHPTLVDYQRDGYGGLAWANEIAKRGYVVMVSDAFPFESRKVHLSDVPEVIRKGVKVSDEDSRENIEAYNDWAGQHEHIMAKSLFSAGTTWPGVFFAEDQKALDVLCAREDVDASKIGCGGLSGGGMRTVFMGGLDERIKCAVCVGFMTTWKDFILYKSFTHTWMTYVPILPNELDFPEILGLRAPLPTMVLNDIDDDLYTMPEMERADNILKEVFTKAKASDRYKCSYYPGPHKFDADMQKEAFAWFDKWLK